MTFNTQSWLGRIGLGMLLFGLIAPHTCHALTFQNVTYDAASDELVIEVAFSGISAEHEFSLA